MNNSFVDSAWFKGPVPPEDFSMSAGAIFYEDKKISDVRLYGKLRPVIVKGEFPIGGRRWPVWREGRIPDLDFGKDFRILLSPQDQGRAYLAMIRFGKLYFLSWDVVSNVADYLPDPADTEVRFIRIAEPPDTSKKLDSVDEKKQYETAIRYVEKIAESADKMKMLLIQVRDKEKVETSIYDSDFPRTFPHAFTHLLKQQIDDDCSGNSSQIRLSIKEMGEWELKENVLEAVMGTAKKSFSMVRGRRRGSKTKNRTLKTKKSAATKKKKIPTKKGVMRKRIREHD